MSKPGVPIGPAIYKAFRDTPKPPCEQGDTKCRHYRACADRRMACGAFERYIQRQDNAAVLYRGEIPSRHLYAECFPKDDDHRSWADNADSKERQRENYRRTVALKDRAA